MQPLQLDDIRSLAPSVFAEQPWERMSDKYRFFPTIKVVEGLLDNGFYPVYAGQSKTRIEGKENFTRHVLRFRHADLIKQASEVSGPVGEVPEIVIMNSHDGTSAYKIMLGFFRLVCANGMIVKSAGISEIAVRHSGREEIIGQVIDGSYEIIKEAPKAALQISGWKNTELAPVAQNAFASAALELRDSAIDVMPERLLQPRRSADLGKDLWTTLNVVQENLIRGGVRGEDAKGNRRRLRGIKSVDADTKLNRALWVLAEKLGEQVAHVQAA